MDFPRSRSPAKVHFHEKKTRKIPYRILTIDSKGGTTRTLNFIPNAAQTINMNEKKRIVRANESVSYVICRLMSFSLFECVSEAVELPKIPITRERFLNGQKVR
jgi:hypothetical protein